MSIHENDDKSPSFLTKKTGIDKSRILNLDKIYKKIYIKNYKVIFFIILY